MKISYIFSLSVLVIAIALNGAAADGDIVIKKNFYPMNSTGPIAEIFISKNGNTFCAATLIPNSTGTPQYAYLAYPGNNDIERWNPKLMITSGFLNSIDALIRYARVRSTPEDVLALFRQFLITYNSASKIKGPRDPFLLKQNWEKDNYWRTLQLKLDARHADKEFTKELDDILEYHHKTYGDEAL